jgi:hypothetical protein
MSEITGARQNNDAEGLHVALSSYEIVQNLKIVLTYVISPCTEVLTAAYNTKFFVEQKSVNMARVVIENDYRTDTRKVFW